MSNTQTKKVDAKQLEALIKASVKKLGLAKENDICRYIPVSTGGYVHHFTMRKMKGENPTQLAKWINKYILDVAKPQKVVPKKRAARGSRKRKDQPQFSKYDIERILNMARLAGESEIVQKLTPKKDKKTIQRELISSIRRGEVDQELWNGYVETMNALNELAAAL